MDNALKIAKAIHKEKIAKVRAAFEKKRKEMVKAYVDACDMLLGFYLSSCAYSPKYKRKELLTEFWDNKELVAIITDLDDSGIDEIYNQLCCWQIDYLAEYRMHPYCLREDIKSK